MVNIIEIFLYTYEYGTLKPVRVILRSGVGKDRIMEGMNKTGVQWYMVRCIFM
jgi:hypothetical protein